MKTLLLFLVSFCSFGAFAAEQPPSEQDTVPLQPLVAVGGFGGAGYSNSVNWTPLIGIDVHWKDVAFNKNEFGNWDGGVLAYFFPTGQALMSLYVYAGYLFLPHHQLSVGPVIGITGQSPSQFNYSFTAGGQISYELPRVWGLSLVPAFSVAAGTTSIAMPVALLSLELRYSLPAHFYTPTKE